MTTDTKPRLRFGYNQGIPDDAKAAWGCRAIWNGSGIPDVVYDRQDAAGDEAEKARLLDHLNTVVRGRWAENVKDGTYGDYAPRLNPTKDVEVTVFEDDTVTIKANTNGSHGYLYVVAFLKGETT